MGVNENSLYPENQGLPPCSKEPSSRGTRSWLLPEVPHQAATEPLPSSHIQCQFSCSLSQICRSHLGKKKDFCNCNKEGLKTVARNEKEKQNKTLKNTKKIVGTYHLPTQKEKLILTVDHPGRWLSKHHLPAMIPSCFWNRETDFA